MVQSDTSHATISDHTQQTVRGQSPQAAAYHSVRGCQLPVGQSNQVDHTHKQMSATESVAVPEPRDKC